jgi:hypothetical protein
MANIATETRILDGVLFKIHNPQVAMAYEEQPFLRSALIIRTADNFTIKILKIAIFYLVCGRINTASTVPMYWSTKVERGLRPQLAIAFRPDKRRRFSFGKYDNNLQLHIPHYNGSQSPKIPSYVVGQHSAKIILKDQSSILVHAESEAEAIRVVEALLHYVDPLYVPKNLVISTTKRKGAALKLSGQKVRPFKADFYPPATQTPQWSIQL